MIISKLKMIIKKKTYLKYFTILRNYKLPLIEFIKFTTLYIYLWCSFK